MGISFGKRVYEALNKQIAEEFGSAYVYMAMSSVFQDMGLDGCARWMMLQAKEEGKHALKIYNHMLERGAKVKLLPIPAPKQDWRAPLHIFEEMLRHEQKITAMITTIYEFAIAEKDYQTQSFITWFINEQIEEEATASRLLDRIRKMQSTELGVMLFDAEVAKRIDP
ncbi:MAG: ferritin [Holosporaceae bacterium]|nr:ferritin [Holosporaceae bacterium]